nr:PREDICTED: von Willebrand factor A domain-containing protein 3B isoform X2 [Lepisosteus oculatus]
MTRDIWTVSASRDKPSFDLKHKDEERKLDLCDSSKTCDETRSQGNKPGKKAAQFEADVRTLISSPKWLKRHGLKESGLNLSQVLSRIGFKHCEDYVHTLQKPVSSQYGEGLFSQFKKDGSIYNLTARRNELQEIVERLTRKMKLYKQRLDWLTSGSRQVFGVIQERSATLVLDFGNISKTQFDLSCEAVCHVIKEQLSQIARFNLICCAPDLQMWQTKAVHTSGANIDSAVEWIWKLKNEPSTSQSSTAEALLMAMSDKTIEAVYLFAVGDFKDNLIDLLRNKLVNSVCPIHTISFNAKSEETVQFLKGVAHLTAGRFHAFAELHGSEPFVCVGEKEGDENCHTPHMSRRLIGGVPPGAGVREDVFLIWREMEEARSTAAEVQAILLESHPRIQEHPGDRRTEMPKSEDCMSSKTWLTKHGLKAQNLLFYDALADCAFRHSDGIVDIKSKPDDESLQTDAEKRIKLVNAKYCERFAHTQWKDGSVVHVYVSAEKCKWYEDRMNAVLENLQKRLEWLQKGSRELFGAVLEDQVYVLVDTSESMKDQLPTLKEKIFQLIQVGGSTNTLGALRLALADVGTDAVYLLTDGRPDQPPKTILAQVQLHPPVPVHTISFNCDDLEANRFLHELSRETGGRFHCYHSDIKEPGAPLPFVSEDTYILKEEIEEGKKDLEKVQKLRAECMVLDWYHNGASQTVKRRLERAHSACRLQTPCKDKAPVRPQSAVDWAVVSHRGHRHLSHTHKAAEHKPHSLCRQKMRHAAHTKTSLLRFLSNGVDISENDSVLDEWMLPETLSVFKMNVDKQSQVLNGLNLIPLDKTQKKARRRKPKESLDMSSARWLKANGLVARRLTIIDALAPTAVPQTTRYIPILDKYIYSKVFDEVLPFAHVSGSKQQLTLVNPQAVNLEGYKKKLEHALKSYERRLNLIVWRALTQEERDKFGSEKPVPFKEHKEALLQALDRLGWPIAQEDVSLLEDEIDTGLSLLQQASDLQKAVKGKADTGGSTKCRQPDERENQMRNTSAVPYKHKRVLDTLRGQKVIARSEIDGFYYPGTVIKCLNSKKATVDFTRGDTQIVPLGFLISIGGSGPCPPLAVGDFVFVGTGTEDAGDCFVPGVVIATPRRTEASDKLYTVLKYNKRKEHSPRRRIIKISQTKYSFACRYIRECQMVDYTIPSVQFVKPVPKVSSQRRKSGSVSSPEEETINTEHKRKDKLKNKHSGRPSDKNDISDSDMTQEEDQKSSSSDEGRQKPGNEPQSSSSYLCRSQERSVDLPASLMGTPFSKRLSTPLASYCSERSEAQAAKPSSTNLLERTATTNQKLEELVQELQKALTEHRSQQEQIQKCVQDLASLKLHGESDFLAEQKQLTTQQREFMEGLEKLTHYSHNGASQQKGEAVADIPEYVNSARLKLPKLSPGQEVLARWSHDGWYYRSSVIHSCGDQSYFLQNKEGELERIWREDIITDGQDSENVIKIEDPVIAVHPLYPECFCPGVVIKVMADLKLEVRYYDGTEGLVSREQTYLIPAQKFEQDVAYMLECEERWVGEPVVARDDATGTYHLAEVQQRVGDGKHYVVCWADGTSTVQRKSFIFGKFSRSCKLAEGDFVLTLADPVSLIFLPGVIQGFIGTNLDVQFINGKRCQHVETHHCFWLSEEQFNIEVQMYNNKYLKHQRVQENEENESVDELAESVYSPDSSTSSH